MIAVSQPIRGTERERTWASLPHFILITSIVVTMAAPLLGGSWGGSVLLVLGGAWGGSVLLVPPLAAALLMWNTRTSSALVCQHARESLNFQITLFLAGQVFVLAAMLWRGPESPNGLFWSFCAALVVVIALSWRALRRAAKGLEYRYPLCLRLFR
jgi:uncharacterized Tic20 family protein